nr:hypothetical protein [Azonexus hydrophilus]
MLPPRFVQVAGNLFRAHRAMPLAVQIQIEDLPHLCRFRWINRQLLFALALVAQLFRLDGLVAERRAGTIPEALPGVLLHRPQRVLAVFLALVLIEDREDFTGHLAGGIVAGLLRDRNQLHPGTFQLAFIQGEFQRIPEEARQAMNDDRFKGRRSFGRFGNHFLKHRAPVIGGRCTSLDIRLTNQIAMALAPFLHLPQLVRNRQVLVSLFDR